MGLKDGFSGQVEDIEQGKVSKDRLYRIKYSDGDLEHFTADQVRDFMERVAAPKGKAKAKAKAAVVEANEDDDEVEPAPAMKKPAAAAKGKAKAAPAVQKNIAKSVPKAKGKAAPKAVLKKPSGR